MATLPNPHRTVEEIPLLYKAVIEQSRRCRDNAGQCWEWTGTINANGYGVLKKADKKGYLHRVLVHNVIWMAAQNPIQTVSPKLSHLCHKKTCIVYYHLVVEPPFVNNQRKECNNSRPRQCKYKNAGGHYNLKQNGEREHGYRDCLI
jgi:hypothetical protein